MHNHTVYENDWEETKFPYKFITITLKPKLYTLPSREQFGITFNKVNTVCQYATHGIFCAELTKKANIYYHLLVHFDDRYDSELPFIRFYDFCRSCKQFGFIHIKAHDIEHIEAYKNAKAYILKHVLRTRQILKAKCLFDIHEGNTIWQDILDSTETMSGNRHLSEFMKINILALNPLNSPE